LTLILTPPRATLFPYTTLFRSDRVTDEMEVATEETFGPVVPITTIQSEDEALALINSSPYGLLTAVFTRDLGRGLRFAEAARAGDRKSTRMNSSHVSISYAVFC